MLIEGESPQVGLDHLTGFVFIQGIGMIEPAQRFHFLLQRDPQFFDQRQKEVQPQAAFSTFKVSARLPFVRYLKRNDWTIIEVPIDPDEPATATPAGSAADRDYVLVAPNAQTFVLAASGATLDSARIDLAAAVSLPRKELVRQLEGLVAELLVERLA